MLARRSSTWTTQHSRAPWTKTWFSSINSMFPSIPTQTKLLDQWVILLQLGVILPFIGDIISVQVIVMQLFRYQDWFWTTPGPFILGLWSWRPELTPYFLKISSITLAVNQLINCLDVESIVATIWLWNGPETTAIHLMRYNFLQV